MENFLVMYGTIAICLFVCSLVEMLTFARHTKLTNERKLMYTGMMMLMSALWPITIMVMIYITVTSKNETP